jgi:hypothetical protein
MDDKEEVGRLGPRGSQQRGGCSMGLTCASDAVVVRRGQGRREEGGPVGVDATWPGPESELQRQRDSQSMAGELDGRRKEKGSNLNLKMTNSNLFKLDSFQKRLFGLKF